MIRRHGGLHANDKNKEFGQYFLVPFPPNFENAILFLSSRAPKCLIDVCREVKLSFGLKKPGLI